MQVISEIFLTVLILGSLYSFITVGFSLIYSVTKIMHLAQGVVVLASAYVFFWFHTHNFPWIVSLLLTILFSIAFGCTMQHLVYEKLRKKGKILSKGSLIASIGIIFIVQNILLMAFGSRAKSIQNIAFEKTYELGSASISLIDIIIIASAFIIMSGILLFMKYSKTGIALRACADNETISEVIGINTKNIRTVAFVIGSALGGIAGVLYALKFNLTHTGGVDIAIKAFARAIVGGVGSLPGALIGNILVEVAENTGAWFMNAAFKDIFSFLILFFFLLFKPSGMFGQTKN